MTEFEYIIAEVFDRGAEHRLDEVTERDMIERAQYGDQDATIALVYAYAATLRAHAAIHAPRLGAEDARATAVSGLMEAIHAFRLDDDSRILGRIAPNYIARALGAVESTATRVPERTVRRYLGILKLADGDYDRALELASSRAMSRETFAAIHAAYSAAAIVEHADEVETGGLHIDRGHPVWAADADAFADADTTFLVDKAFLAVDTKHGDVMRYAYGFATGDPLSDGEVAEAISVRDLGEGRVSAGESTLSRATAQRRRHHGLAQMRSALGLA